MLSLQIPGQTHAHAEFEFVDDTGCTLSKIFQDDLDYLRSLEPVMIIWLGRVNIITANRMISLREILLRVNIPVEGVRHRVNKRNTTGYLGQWTVILFVVDQANVPPALRVRLSSTWTRRYYFTASAPAPDGGFMIATTKSDTRLI